MLSVIYNYIDIHFKSSVFILHELGIFTLVIQTHCLISLAIYAHYVHHQAFLGMHNVGFSNYLIYL